MRATGWGLLWMLAIAPCTAQDFFRGCMATGWDCKAQSKHPEVFGRPLNVPGLEGTYQVIAHAPAASVDACQARLTAVTVRGAAMLPDFPNVAVTAVALPGMEGVAVRTGPVDEVWLCVGATQVVLVPWHRLGSQVRLARAMPGAMDPPTLPTSPTLTAGPDEDPAGEMEVAAMATSGGIRALCRDGTAWLSARDAQVCEAHGGLAAWLTTGADPAPATSSVTPPASGEEGSHPLAPDGAENPVSSGSVLLP